MPPNFRRHNSSKYESSSSIGHSGHLGGHRTFGYTKLWQRDIQPQMESCIAETGVRRDLAERVLTYGEFVEDRKLKCYLNCALRPWGLIEEKDGSTKVDKLLKIANYEAGDSETCDRIFVKGDPCESTFRLIKCLYSFERDAIKAEDAVIHDRKKRTLVDLQLVWHGHVLKHFNECVAETDVKPELGLRFIKYDEFVEDSKLKCFVTCILKKAETTNDDGTGQDEIYDIKVQVNDHKVLEASQVAEKCFNTESREDLCEQGFSFYKCVFSTVKNYIKGTISKSEL